MKTVEWGFLIVNYLFLGGLSAGLFFVAALATLFYKDGETSPSARIAQLGAWLSPWPVMLGCFLLIFDLGHWYRFYKLFLHMRLGSPMSIGSWLLVLFNLVALTFAWAWLDAARRASLLARLPKFVRGFNPDLSNWKRGLAAVGLPISVGVGIYTGVLLGAVQSRPFWNTNLVAQLFLFSALSTGCAALMLGFVGRETRTEELRTLYALDISFLTLEFFIVLPYIIHGQLSVQAVQDSLKLILGGPYTVLFWLFFLGLGLLLPLTIEVRELFPVVVRDREFHYSRPLAAGTALLVLGGGFLLRYIFVFAGQVSAIQ
jgi:formate-dependent nitrite reductase membrane component NrfD